MANENAFTQARECFEEMLGWLEGSESAQLSHADLEDEIVCRGRETQRLAFQDHPAPRGALTYPPRSGEGLEVISLGPMADLDSKGEGDNSIPLSRLSCPGVRGEEAVGPRDTAKA